MGKQELIGIRDVVDPLAQRRANSMTGASARLQENWLPASARLQARRHLPRVHRIDAGVVRPRHEQDRRIFGPTYDVMIRGVRKQSPELIRLFHCAKLSHVKRPIRRQLKSQHVVDPHMGNHGGIQLRPLCECRSHQKSPVADAFDRQSRRFRVTLVVRKRAHASKSSNTFCLLVKLPARCHFSPYSPPPRRFAMAYTTPRSKSGRKVGSKYGGKLMPYPPYPVSRAGLFPS